MNALQTNLAFAVPGESHLIDTCDPDTMRSHINGETLEQIRERYPTAEVVKFDEWMLSQAAKQRDVPREWKPTTRERYWEMLECLPPAAMARGAFLVGEPYDHCFSTGRPTFSCFQEGHDGTYWELSAHITFKEFNGMFGPTSNDYRE